jgi:hypothetical protein
MVVTKSTTQVIATTCEVYFGGSSLGHTQGAITVNVTKNSFDVLVNDFGPNVPVTKTSLGTGATVEVPLAQYDVQVLLTAIPEAVTVSGNAAYVGDTTGTNFLDLAQELIVAPKDGSDQWRFPAAAVTEELSIPFQLDEQTIITATFTTFPDPVAPTASGSVFKIEPNQFF